MSDLLISCVCFLSTHITFVITAMLGWAIIYLQCRFYMILIIVSIYFQIIIITKEEIVLILVKKIPVKYFHSMDTNIQESKKKNKPNQWYIITPFSFYSSFSWNSCEETFFRFSITGYYYWRLYRCVVKKNRREKTMKNRWYKEKNK